MNDLFLGVSEPFASPAWNCNMTIFSNSSGGFILEKDSKEYINKACKYAKHYEVYLVPERFVLLGYQCMCLISPEGKVLGAQKCICRNEKEPDIKKSTELEVISTEFGGVAMCVDVDVYRPEISRVAANMGAQILICSQQIHDGDYNNGLVSSGVWNAAQSNNIFTIGITNAFNCVCAPRPMTRNNDGFLVIPNSKIPLTAKISVDELAKLPPKLCLDRKLYAIHRQELIN